MNFWQKLKRNIIKNSNIFFVVFLLIAILLPATNTASASALPSWSSSPLMTLLSGAATGGLGGTPAGVAPAAIAGSAVAQYGDSALKIAKDSVIATIGTALYYLSTVVFVISKVIFNGSTYLINILINYSLTNSAIDLVNIINPMWMVVRDFANLSLIFIILYISISTVLGLNGANTYKMLGKVVLIGLVMNFSLVITNVVIDVSNIISLQFLNAIDKTGNGDVAGAIGSALDIDKLISNTAAAGTFTNQSLNMAVVMFGTSIFLLLAVFVLVAGAAMFLVRIVKLMAVMIFSPLAFAASILPKTEGVTKQWWGELSSNALFAPVYLFMIYISLSMLVILVPNHQMPYSTIIDTFIGTHRITVQDGASAGARLAGFVLAIGLLLASVTAASKLAGETAKSGQALAGLALGTGAGAIAATGRQSLGRISQSIYEGQEDKNSTLARIADYGRKGTYDVRNAKVPDFDAFGAKIRTDGTLGAGVETISSQVGVKTGGGIIFNDAKASAGGRAKEQADIEKADAEIKKARDIDQRKFDLAKLKEDLKTPPANYATASAKDKKDIDQGIAENLKKFNNDEISDLIGSNMFDTSKEHLIRNLNASAVKSLAEKGTLTEANKDKIKELVTANRANNQSGYGYYREAAAKKDLDDKLEAAQKDITDILAGTPGARTITDFMDNVQDEVLVKLDVNVLTDSRVAQELSGAQLANIQKAGILKNRLQREKVRQAVETYQANVNGNEYLAANAGRGLW